MSWLSSPKVRLALIVNGLYFVSHFVAPSPPHARPRFFAQARESLAERAQRKARADNVPLAPPYAPSRASADESGGVLHVSLKKDLTLVRRPGRTLVLSPTFSAPLSPPAEPATARLNFIRYSKSDGEPRPDGWPLVIEGDEETLWPEDSASDPMAQSYSWKRESVPYSSSKLEDGRVVETMAAESFTAEVPYDTFLNIISARRVVIKLGPDRVELNADQIEALRDMHRSLP